MSYPRVILKIENYSPSVLFMPDEGLNRKMTLQDENLLALVLDLAKQVGLLDESPRSEIEKNMEYDRLLMLARTADELTFEQSLDINTEENEFVLKDTLMKLLNQTIKNTEVVDVAGLSDELQEELKTNQKLDIFAAILDSLYRLLIAKTLLHSASLGIGDIYLDDKHHNSRLRELMARELNNMGVDLLISD